MLTIDQIYKKAIAMGIAADPREAVTVEKFLKKKKKQFGEMPEKKKQFFDMDELFNPYADSRVLVGDPSTKVSKVLAGIDMNASEVLLADRLNQKGEKIDLLISHHPEGLSLAGIHDVMDLQIDVLARYGIPINVAEGILKEKIHEIHRRFNPRNHNQAVDAAKLLGIPLMCTHTITDNLVYQFLVDLFQKNPAETVGDVLDTLMTVPEYQEAEKGKAGPIIDTGSQSNRAGMVAPLEVTGGTDGSHLMYEKLAAAGIGTIIAMHTPEEHRKEAAKHHINIVVAGHMSSDSLGMNLLLDQLEKEGIAIIPCSGLIRIKRTN